MADCPRCLVEQLRPPEGEYDGRACKACRGAWLPTDAAQRLIADPFGALANLPRSPTGVHAPRCPTCRAALERRNVAAIEIDVCMQHGAWFDHREIDRVRSAATQHRQAELAPHDRGLAATAVASVLINPSATQSSQSNDAGLDIAVDAADLALSTADVTGATDVAVSVLEIVDVGEVAGGAFELLSGALEALFSGF